MLASVNTWLISTACLIGFGLPAMAVGDSSDLQSGYGQLVKGDYKGAVKVLSKAVHDQPSNQVARRYLAHALLRAGFTTQAVEQFEAAAFINPLEPADLTALGDLYLSTGSTQKAIAVYRQALLKDRKMSAAWVGLTKGYLALGQHEVAVATCRQALNVTNSPENHQYLTDLLQRLEQQSRAVSSNSSSRA